MKYVLSLAIAISALAGPASAHETLHCATMRQGIAAMQAEVDGLRRSVRRLARADAGRRGAAAALQRRADVEQSRIDGMRHNFRRCSHREK